MGMMVHLRLGDVFRARKLTVDDPWRQIARRLNVAVDARTLDRLTRRRLDLVSGA